MKKLILGNLIVLMMLMAPVKKTWAYECCDPWGAVGLAAFVTAGQAVVSSVTTSTTSLVLKAQKLYQTLDSGFSKVTGEQSKQTAAQKTYKQGAIAASSQLYTQSRAGEAAENAVLPSGLAVTVTNAALLSEQNNVVRQKITKANADFAATVYSTKAVDETIVTDRHKPYCSAGDVNVGRCETAASPTMQNADISYNTIVGPGEGQYETLSDEERDAAVAFVQQVVNPVPGVRGQLKNKSVQEKYVDSLLLTDQAAMSLSANSFNAAIAHRTRRHQQ